MFQIKIWLQIRIVRIPGISNIYNMMGLRQLFRELRSFLGGMVGRKMPKKAKKRFSRCKFVKKRSKLLNNLAR